MAEIGFAVNLNGDIYSPTPYEGPAARTFRDENDRFLSNRENVEVYSSNSVVVSQNVQAKQNGVAQFSLKEPDLTLHANAENSNSQEQSTLEKQAQLAGKDNPVDSLKKASQAATFSSAAAPNATRSLATTKNSSTSSATDFASDMSNAKALPAPTATANAESEASVAPTAAAPPTLTPPPPMPESAAAESTPATAPPAAAAPALSGEATGAIQAPESTIAALASITNAAQPPSTDNAGIGGAPNSNANLNNNANLAFAKIQRQVIPQQMFSRDTASLSNTVPEESDFRRVIGTETSGALARFLENKMRLMVWSHPAQDAPIVFGAQLNQAKVVQGLQASLQIPELAPDSFSRTSNGEICAAILDDTGHPVALSRPGFQGDWKHPFVATEIGEVLPHWEAALYLVDPQQISRAARTLQLTFGLIVLLLVAAIVSGGSLIAADVRRQVRLAQQKTDFVSNVSHELKTPLTSIRMFAELLAEKRVPDEERQSTYLRIIAAEASRLTRLINNVLDFARLERGAPGSELPGEQRDCDLVDAVRDVVETCGPHLEAAGISFRSEIEAETLPIRGDRDALAQIILNLISNAEKYGGNDVLVRVRRQETAAGALGCVDVLDRGAGIPARQVKTIFEPFHRLDDSLSSGLPGSGLGLTLARRMARAHGGDVTYSARAGGGSCFTLSIPLAHTSATT